MVLLFPFRIIVTLRGWVILVFTVFSLRFRRVLSPLIVRVCTEV